MLSQAASACRSKRAALLTILTHLPNQNQPPLRKYHASHLVTPRTEELFIGDQAHIAVDKYVTTHNYQRVMLIASRTLDQKTNEIKQIEDVLGNRLSAKVTGITEHNPQTDQLRSIQMAKECNADLILCIGGGSVTDNGKLTGLIANDYDYDEHEHINHIDHRQSHSCSVSDLEGYRAHFEVELITDERNRNHNHNHNHNHNVSKKFNLIPSQLKNTGPQERQTIPVLLIPTTLSGTSAIAGCTNITTNKKELYFHPQMIPRAIIFDPLITRHTPEWLWISTGIRAFDHCIETLASLYSNPLWDTSAATALISLYKHLPLTMDSLYSEPYSTDAQMNARYECLIASYLSMVAIAQGCPMGGSHAIGHQLGGLKHVPHGHTSCVMTPNVLAYNYRHGDARVRQRQELIRHSLIFGAYEANVHQNEEKVRQMQDEMSTAAIVHEFIRSLQMPRHLNEVGVFKDDFESIAELSVDSFWSGTNPVPLLEKQQIMDILATAQTEAIFTDAYNYSKQSNPKMHLNLK